jgi:hypothetical protein
LKTYSLAFLSLFCLLNSVSADLLCSRIVLNKKNQEIIKSKIVTTAKCPKGFSKVTDTSIFVGAVGPQGLVGATGATGPQGASAISNITELVTLNEQFSNTNFNTNAYELFTVGTFEKLADSTKLKFQTSTAVNVAIPWLAALKTGSGVPLNILPSIKKNKLHAPSDESPSLATFTAVDV